MPPVSSLYSHWVRLSLQRLVPVPGRRGAVLAAILATVAAALLPTDHMTAVRVLAGGAFVSAGLPRATAGLIDVIPTVDGIALWVGCVGLGSAFLYLGIAFLTARLELLSTAVMTAGFRWRDVGLLGLALVSVGAVAFILWKRVNPAATGRAPNMSRVRWEKSGRRSCK
jgi:hypothetical protein